jgi:hypothetical protein
MSDTASAASPTSGPYIIASIAKGPGQLYRVIVIDDDGNEHAFILATRELNLETIRLSAYACSQLWETKNGATPLAVVR